MVSYVRAKTEKVWHHIASTLMRRPERIAYLSGALLFGAELVGLGLAAVCESPHHLGDGGPGRRGGQCVGHSASHLRACRAARAERDAIVMIDAEEQERSVGLVRFVTPSRPEKLAIVAMLLFWGWAAAMTVRGTLRWDHVALPVFATLLAFGPGAAKHLLRGLVPLGFVALAFDAMRFVEHVGLSESTIHVCDRAPSSCAGSESRAVRNASPCTTGCSRVPPHGSASWPPFPPTGRFSRSSSAIASTSSRATSKRSSALDGHFAVNLLGFVTYHLYPAAPPWYFHRYGCTVDLRAAASAGPNLMRVDELLGISYSRACTGAPAMSSARCLRSTSLTPL